MSYERILIVDDEAHIVHLCTRVLTVHGYAVEGITSGQEAIARLEAELRPQGEGFHLLVVDIRMPDVDGLTVLRRGRELDPLLAAVVITGYGTLDSAIEALHAGAQRFVLKPFESQDLLLTVEEALAQRRKEQERLHLRAQLPILEIGQALLADGSVESMAGPLLEIVMRQTGADRAALLLLDEGADELYVVKAIDLPIDETHTQRISTGQSVAGRALMRQELQVLDVQSPANLEPPWQTSVVEGDVSLVYIPLHGRKQEVGVLSLVCAQKAFAPADLTLLSIMGQQIAIALENTRLYQAVVQAERQWAETFDAITVGISIHDAEFRFVRANRTLAGWLGIPAEELVGQTCYTLLHHEERPPTLCPLAQTMANGRPHTVEIEEPVLGGMFQVSTYPISNGQGQVTGAVHTLHNITERKRMEQQLIQSEKLAALGRLAASLAHEINNPLQALRSGLGLLIQGSHEKEKRQQYLQVANREVERLIAITERMLNFHRPAAEQPKRTDVNDVLDEVLTLVGKKLQHSRVTLSRNLDRHLPPVEAVADQLRQVFLNIVLNALDAMPDGGELTVASGFDRQRREAWISFADTGEGISVEDMPRLFEPLYSTKPRGTGLGLAVSYSIIERQNGRIEVQSEVGAGSTFTVFLPV